jgi:hypothetical protein
MVMRGGRIRRLTAGSGVFQMRLQILATAFAGAVMMSHAAFAQQVAQTSDDVKWVNQCLADNSDAKVSAAVVRKYCVCMNNKMSDNETRSITQWEKSHPTERKACDAEAGWR